MQVGKGGQASVWQALRRQARATGMQQACCRCALPAGAADQREAPTGPVGLLCAVLTATGAEQLCWPKLVQVVTNAARVDILHAAC